MSPQEKAKELFEKYYQINKNHDYDYAIQCALIAIDEVLSSLYEIDNSYYWWQEVKEEIEKL